VISPECLLFIDDSNGGCAADLNGEGEVGGADLGLLFVDRAPVVDVW
jgi:hypothetical protein